MNKPYFFAGISIFCWSTAAVVAKLMMKGLTNFQLLFISSFFAGVSLFIFSLFTRRKLFKTYRFSDYIKMILCTLPSTFLYYVFFYKGTDIMPLANQALIVNYLWPIMSVFFACIILHEKITNRKILAFVVSFIGIAVVAGEDILKLNTESLKGAFFCILGAISYGFYTAVIKKAGYDKVISLSVGYFASFILTGIIVILQDKLFLPTLSETLGIMWNGVFAIAIPNVCWLFALKSGETAKISNLAYVTPFISLIWSRLILKEDIKLLSVLGLCIIVVGIFIQLTDKKNKC